MSSAAALFVAGNATAKKPMMYLNDSVRVLRVDTAKWVIKLRPRGVLNEMRRGAGREELRERIATDEMLQRRCRQRAELELQGRREAIFSTNEAKKQLVLRSDSAATAECAPREEEASRPEPGRGEHSSAAFELELSARNR
jgi:hypothetical protein